MAHVEVVQTGLRVVTHVRGRVTRYSAGEQSNQSRKREQSLAARSQAGAKRRLRVCLLSALDARHLADYGVSQPCHGPQCRHRHHTRERIEALVKSGDLAWVGEGQNVAAWPDPREWRGLGGSMQWVPVGSGMSRLEQRELARASFQSAAE